MAEPERMSSYETIEVGTQETFARVIDGAAIDSFANAIQSFHPIHTDGDWARKNAGLPDRVAHGLMTSALMSRPMTDLLQRCDLKTVLLSITTKYLRPVVCGDTVTTTVRLAEKMDPRKRVRFSVECTNQRGEVVMVGDALEQVID
jgi:acyl dehydratase